jgi:hypothetical protein
MRACYGIVSTQLAHVHYCGGLGGISCCCTTLSVTGQQRTAWCCWLLQAKAAYASSHMCIIVVAGRDVPQGEVLRYLWYTRLQVLQYSMWTLLGAYNEAAARQAFSFSTSMWCTCVRLFLWQHCRDELEKMENRSSTCRFYTTHCVHVVCAPVVCCQAAALQAE